MEQREVKEPLWLQAEMARWTALALYQDKTGVEREQELAVMVVQAFAVVVVVSGDVGDMDM